MGWLFMQDRNSLEDLVAHFRAPGYWREGWKILKDSVVGYHYWAAIRRPDGRTFVFLALMQNGRQNGWGYKDLCCSMHPYHYDCPLSILAATAEPAPGSSAAEWRAKVREHHCKKGQTKSLLKAGNVVSYAGISYHLDKSLGRKGWSVTRVTDGAKMRLKARQANEAGRSLLSARALA